MPESRLSGLKGGEKQNKKDEKAIIIIKTNRGSLLFLLTHWRWS